MRPTIARPVCIIFLLIISLFPFYYMVLLSFRPLDAVLQGANALIFYPLLDFATDMNGDWRQMYSGDAGNWRWVVLAGCRQQVRASATWVSMAATFR